MFNFEKLLSKGEDYVSGLGVAGGIGGAAGLYAFAGVQDPTTLLVIAASAAVPAMMVKGSPMLDEIVEDALILAGPIAALWWYEMLQINVIMYFATGALVASAISSTLMMKTKNY